MYTLIITFYISLILVILMIWNKHHEVTSGHPSVLSRWGTKTDNFFNSIFAHIKKGFSYLNKHTFIALAQWMTFHVLVRVRKVYVYLKHQFISHPHGKRMIDAVRGRGEVKDHGASFYLRRISRTIEK
ncbi:MAG: hypothetical protein WCG07_01285 [Candidatus Taylorbacteria bacterium]